ncbi:MAG: hypothetical protein VX652_01430 [Candidatus Thermoplasmatota archaeon]|nr:hypothetical protein [Candidatus Thermoplasmatota archaeon]
MVPVWPFKKKSVKPRISRQRFVSNVVEYERKGAKDTKSRATDESHLKDRKFLDAMKLLSKKED